MSPVIKGVAGVGIPAAGIGGTYLYLKGMNENMPEFKYIQSPDDSKFGKDYQFYLADASENGNDDWWQWSFINVYKPDSEKTSHDFSSAFQSINDATGLKNKCKESYSKTTATELTDTNSRDDKAKHGRDAWKYCSKFGGKPGTVGDNEATGKSDENNLKSDGGYKGKIGETKKSELVSVTDTSEANNKFWEERAREFFGEAGKKSLGEYNKTEKSEDKKKNIFDKLYDDKENISKKGEKLKEKCGEAYKETTSNDDGKVKDVDVVKYCGLKVTVV